MTTKWLIAFYGWFLYNAFAFYMEKQKSDKKGEEFHYKLFVKTHWDNWAITFLVIIPVVSYGQEIHNLLMQFTSQYLGFSVKWYDIFYAGPGPLVELLYFLATMAFPILRKRFLKKIDEPGQ